MAACSRRRAARAHARFWSVFSVGMVLAVVPTVSYTRATDTTTTADAPSRSSFLRSGRALSSPERESHGASRELGGDEQDSPQNLVVGAAAPALRLSPSEARNSDDDVLSFYTSNEYKPVTSTPWPRLAEPFRATTLIATSAEGDPSMDLFFFTVWEEKEDAFGKILEGREVKYMFKHVGKQRVTVTQVVASTGRIYRSDSYVMVKYVRREIRQLTEKDREAFFHAVETLYRLPTAQGNRIYGDDYKGIEFFVQMHLDGAGVKDCDHWHDDAGIMTHHVGYTLLFEQALQLVNPAVTVPYWEYTVEASMGYSWLGQSEVFAPDWFGDANPGNALHTMNRGRFAYLPIMQDATEYIHNAYGLLRTPWNLDSTPYVTRHNLTNNAAQATMVTCDDYEGCFQSESLASINTCLNGGTHGPVHIIMGGEWNDPEEMFIKITGYAEDVPLVTKYLWRKGYLRVPEACSPTEDGVGDASTCRASCPTDLYESRGMTPYDVLKDALVLHWVGRFSNGIIKHISEEDRFVVAGHEDDPDFQAVFWKKLLHSFCDPGHVGELFTSSAPYDPLFWVIHPTAERFLDWWRILGRDFPETYPRDETWGYSHKGVIGETGMICDWSDVREGTLDMPTCIKGICGGHNAKDLLPFQIKVKDEVRKMTNQEWLDFIYPTNEDLPYVYNEYRWDHCGTEAMRAILHD